MVREALLRLLDETDSPSPQRQARSTIVDAETVSRLAPGAPFPVPVDALITPLARDVALERGIDLVPSARQIQVAGPPDRSVALGADHGGFTLKEELKPFLAQLGWEVVDCGTHGPESVDYPDFAYAVAALVADNRVQWGIVIDGAGIGSCMAANKVPGVRAALCYDLTSAVNSREHNHANVLTLGAGLIGPNLARQIVQTWLETPFGPDRHARRVAKIAQIEKRFSRP
jgi:ribose 5-phosphate isomerase B